MIPTQEPKPLHIIDHELVLCLSSAAYQFVALLDEVLWHTRTEPVGIDQVGVEAHGCWEALDTLKCEIKQRGYSEDR